MKRTTAILTVFVMIFMLSFSTTAFAAEIEPAYNSSETRVDGSLASTESSFGGYGSYWYTAGNTASGSFTFTVSGSSILYGHLTVNIENFDSTTSVQVQIYNASGKFVWGNLDNSGDYITMSNKDDWHDIGFWNANVGTYTVKWSILDGGSSSSGRINVWIY